MKTKSIFSNIRLSKALIGMSQTEFEALIPAFTDAWKAIHKSIPGRVRSIGAGKKGKLPSIEDKLAFILLYLKCYPTFDLLGFLTDRDRTRCCRSVQTMLPILEMALGRNLVLPKRKISSPEEFFKLFPGAREVFIDGTERRVEKPKNLKKRNKLYSGKKKATTRKTVVVNDKNKRILVLTPTKSGRRHDKRLADKNQLIQNIPKDVSIWTDTGFQGIQKQHDHVVMPTKATKNYPLTPRQKQENKLISSIRVVSEHAIGGMKRLKAASDTYRNKLANLDDTFTLLAAGLWNFHLQQTA
jgi:DDE superfamily endonuclease/Helix-turn-helix of DDE superfamily endonuclease